MKRLDDQLITAARSIAASSTLRDDRMSAVVDLLWNSLAGDGLSWVGFYLMSSGASQDCTLILGPRRDKPACSPIGMHGACGSCANTKRSIVVADVRDLGANYIACDPLDRSELVVPCIDDAGEVWGVIDLDSHLIGYFTGAAAAEIEQLVCEAGLSPRGHPFAISRDCV